MIGKFITTLLVGTLGGLIGMKLKLPAGALFGAMIFAAVYNLITDAGYVPPQMNTILQIIMGAAIGLNFKMSTIRGLGSILFTAVVMVIGLMVFSLLLGWIIHRLTGIDLMTALFSTSPGGLANIVLISDAYGAQAHIVALLHTLRLVSVVIFMPLLARLFGKVLS